MGTASHCKQIAGQTSKPIRTHVLGLTSKGDTANLLLGSRVAIMAMEHVHSEAQAPTDQYPPLLIPPDLTQVITNPPSPTDLLDLASHAGDQEGGTVLYRFKLGAFSLLWHDSSGPIRDFPRVVNRLRALPRTTVQVGAIQGFGQYTNGLRDPLDYVRAVRPRIFVPSHHDNWTPPLSTPAAGYEDPLRKALAQIPAASRPALRFIADPTHYIRPGRLTFAL